VNKIKSFTESYEACYAELDRVSPEAWHRVRCFVILFFMPLIWPVCWWISKIRSKE
jgi:hypothetical protein